MDPKPPDQEQGRTLDDETPPGRSWEGAHRSIERRERCRSLRRNMTPAERSFWERVRAGRCHGLKWRPQHPIGPFVADFYCRALSLVVELDGQVHAQTAERDPERDLYFVARGLRIVRIENCDWFTDPDRVLAELCAPWIHR
jgi:very-short-patch-repair endonuclease